MGENQLISLRSSLFHCTAALLLLCSFLNCRAQDDPWNDTGSWAAVSVRGSLGEKLSAAVRIEHRTKENFSTLNQAYCRASLYYSPAEWLRIDGNLDYAYTPQGARLRFLPGLRISERTDSGIFLYLRQWYMGTWYPDEDKAPSKTLRTKLGASRRLGESPFTPHFDYEIFWWDEASQQRFYAGTRVRLCESASLDAFYLYQMYPIQGSGTHIIGLALSFTLP